MFKAISVDEKWLTIPIESMRVITKLSEGVFADVFLVEDEVTKK